MDLIKSCTEYPYDGIKLGKCYMTKNGNKYYNLECPVKYIKLGESRVPFEPYENNFCVEIGQDFQERLDSLRQHIVGVCMGESVNIFGSVKTQEELEQIVQKIYRQTNPEYPPTLPLSKDGKSRVYNKEKIETCYSDIKRDSCVKCAIYISKLYYNPEDRVVKVFFNFKECRILGKQMKQTVVTEFNEEDDDYLPQTKE